MKDLISIIIPVYNVDRYLMRTIESLENQTYPNIEIILINDGSTDLSPTIIKECSDKYSNIIFREQKNAGVSFARNNGLSIAKGKYIMFLDADDYLPNYSVEKLYRCIKEYETDIAMGITKRVIEDKNNEVLCMQDNESHSFCYDKTNVLKSFLLCDSDYDFHSSCAKIYKYDTIKNLRFEEGRSSNEDRYFLFNAICNSNSISFVESEVYVYFKHNDSLSNSIPNKRLFDNLYFAECIDKKIKTNYKDLVNESNYNKLITYMLVYRNFKRHKECIKLYRDELKKLRNDILNMEINYLLPKSKHIELFIIKYLNFLYHPFVMIYDFLYKKDR